MKADYDDIITEMQADRLRDRLDVAVGEDNEDARTEIISNGLRSKTSSLAFIPNDTNNPLYVIVFSSLPNNSLSTSSQG